MTMQDEIESKLRRTIRDRLERLPQSNPRVENKRARSTGEKARNVAAFKRAAAQDKARRTNALEAALSRTPHGRWMLDRLSEAARWRIHEALALELVRSASETLARLRRGLDRRDPLEQQRAALQIPAAERELAKWRKAALDYELRRELTEAALRDGIRVLTE